MSKCHACGALVDNAGFHLLADRCESCLSAMKPGELIELARKCQWDARAVEQDGFEVEGAVELFEELHQDAQALMERAGVPRGNRY